MDRVVIESERGGAQEGGEGRERLISINTALLIILLMAYTMERKSISPPKIEYQTYTHFRTFHVWKYMCFLVLTYMKCVYHS